MAKAKPSVPAPITPLEAIDMEIRALQVHQLAAMEALTQRKRRLVEAEEQRNAVSLINAAKERAMAALKEAQDLALKYDLGFDFSLEYGMGGTFNGTSWNGSSGNYKRTGEWQSSSSNC